MEHLFDKSATWACLIWEKFMNWIPWKMEGKNVLSQTNSTSHRMPVLSCAQPGEYTYKNISCKVEKYNSTFDFHHPFYFFLFCLFGLDICYIQGYTRNVFPKELSYLLCKLNKSLFDLWSSSDLIIILYRQVNFCKYFMNF